MTEDSGSANCTLTGNLKSVQYYEGVKINAAVDNNALVLKQRRQDGLLHFQQNLNLNFWHQEPALGNSDRVGEIPKPSDKLMHCLEENKGPGGKD